jgi:hypothetical protein
MKVGIISEQKTNRVNEYNLDERRVYVDALENFARGETYQNTPDPLRTSLQHGYAQFMVECFKRDKRNSRSHAVRFNSSAG